MVIEMERYAKECQKANNNENGCACESLKSSYVMKTASKFPSSGKITKNSFCDDCNESTLRTFYEFDRIGKVFDGKFTNKNHRCPHYFGITESQSQESLKNVSKNDQCPANVNICTNELFTASHTNTNTAMEVHSGEKYLEKETNFPEWQSKTMESVENDSHSYCCSDNEDVLVKKLGDECDGTVIYASVMQPKFNGVPPEHEGNRMESLPRSRDHSHPGQLQHFSLVTTPDLTTCSSLNPSEDTSDGSTWKSKELEPLSEDKDSRLQTVCMTSNLLLSKEQTRTESKNSRVQTTASGSCKHNFPLNKKSTSEDVPSCRICHSVTDLETLVSPCLCTGSLKYVHESCLLNWLKSSVKTNCELCLHEVRVKKLLKPLREWRFLDEKPVAIIWLLSFLILLALNLLSVIKDASRGCSSTTCIVFYVLGSTGAMLGVIFLWFWAKKSAVYFRKLLTLNQVWLLEETYNNAKNTGRTSAIMCNV